MFNQLKTMSLATLLESTSSVEYIVEPLLPVKGTCVLGGDAGIGKTYLCFRLAIDVARGEPFLGRYKTRQGKVLIIDEENGTPLIKNRMEALLHGDEAGNINDLPIVFAAGQGVNVSSPEGVGRFYNVLQNEKPTLVIIDSLVRIHRANENSANEMSEVLEHLKWATTKHEVAILFTHHSRKPSAIPGASAHSLRGSGDIRAFVDTQLTMRKNGQDLILQQDKARYTEPTAPLSIRIGATPNDGMEVACVGETATSHAQNKTDAFIAKNLGDGPKTRKELLSLAQSQKIPTSTVDKRLKALYDQTIISKLPRVDGETPYALVMASAN